MRFLHNTSNKATYKKIGGGVSLLALLAVPLVAGCGGGGGGNGNTGGGTTGTTNTGTTNSGTNSGTQNPLSVSGMTNSNLTATISEPSATVGVGGTVTYTLTLTNATGAAILIRSTGPSLVPSAVVNVTGPSGASSYQQLPGSPPLANGSLAPGQSISTTTTANGFTTAGTYSATATFGDDTSGIPKSVGPLTVTVQ